MSDVPYRREAAELRALDVTRKLWPIALWLVVLLVAIPWQMRWGVIPDASWGITMSERILAGDRLYVNLIEANPPFTAWLYLPAVYLAQIIAISPEIVVHVYVYGLCLFGLGFAAFVARRAEFPENPALFALSPVILAMLVLFPGNAFSERENIGLALFLPLTVLMAWRAKRNGQAAPGLGLAALAGLSGSVMVLIKPYYAIMVLAPALCVAWQRRSVRSLFTVEYWTIALVCTAYLLAVFRFYPEFLTQVYPLLADTYLQVKWYIPSILSYGGTYLFAVLVLRSIRPGVAFSPLVAVLTVASLAALVPLFYQGKGWPYHAYPAVALILMALLCRLAQVREANSPNFFMKGLVALTVLINGIPFFISQKPDADLVSAIRSATDRPSVELVGTGIETGHPLTRMIEGRWLSSYCSDWVGGMAAYLARAERANGYLIAAERHEAMERNYLDLKMRRMENSRPDLILFQKEDELWNGHVMREHRFVALMKNYRFLAESQSVTVFIRNEYKRSAAATGMVN